MTNTEQREKFLDIFAAFRKQAKDEGIGFIVWTFYRSPADQNYLYQQGRTRPGQKITNCDGFITLSNHQRWLAVDILIIEDGAQIWERTPEYDRLGEIWTSLGGRWGGTFTSPDCYHFELLPD